MPLSWDLVSFFLALTWPHWNAANANEITHKYQKSCTMDRNFPKDSPRPCPPPPQQQWSSSPARIQESNPGELSDHSGKQVTPVLLLVLNYNAGEQLSWRSCMGVGGIKECIGMRMGWPSYAQSAQLRCSSLFYAVQKTSAKLTAPHTQTFGQIINATYVT